MEKRSAWQGLLTCTGCKPRKKKVTLDNTQEFVEDLNIFYTRYDVLDFSDKQSEQLEVLLSLENDRSDVTETGVRNIFKGASSKKATGPHGISSNIFNTCSDQLAGVFARPFQLCLNTDIHMLWKTSCIIPVPKVSKPVENNDYRPVALT